MNSSCVTKGTIIATAEVVIPRVILIWLTPSGRDDTSPCSCWKSRRVSWQLYFCATPAARNTSFSSLRLVSP